MIQQLRIYEIFEHNKEAFQARFRDHAMRIMKRYGFAFVARGRRPRNVGPTLSICSPGRTSPRRRPPGTDSWRMRSGRRSSA